MTYSRLHTQTSLREYRMGRDLSNRMAAILIAIGIGLMTFAVLYVGASVALGFEVDSIWPVIILMTMSNFLIGASILRRPKRLFETEGTEEDEVPVTKRRLAGGVTLLIGFAFEAAAYVCFEQNEPNIILGSLGVWLALAFGPAFIFGGIAILWGPMMRPWKQGSTMGLLAEEQSDDD